MSDQHNSFRLVVRPRSLLLNTPEDWSRPVYQQRPPLFAIQQRSTLLDYQEHDSILFDENAGSSLLSDTHKPPRRTIKYQFLPTAAHTETTILVDQDISSRIIESANSARLQLTAHETLASLTSAKSTQSQTRGQEKLTHDETRSATIKHDYNSIFTHWSDPSIRRGLSLNAKQCSRPTMSGTAACVHPLDIFFGYNSTMMSIDNMPNRNYRTMCSIDITISTEPVVILEMLPCFSFSPFYNLTFLLFCQTFPSLLFCLYANRFCSVSLLQLL